MRLFILTCRLHPTWHEWLRSGQRYIPNPKYEQKVVRVERERVINVPRIDAANKDVALVFYELSLSLFYVNEEDFTLP